MNAAKRIALLERLLAQASDITVRDSDDPTFKTWKNTVERTLIRVFGSDSPEIAQFQKLRFFYSAMIMSLGASYDSEHRESFDRDLEILLSSIKNYIEEIEQDLDSDSGDGESVDRAPSIDRVFISHASAEADLAEQIVDLLELIGVPSEAIFCTSVPGYGIELGDDFLDAIKDELSGETLVLFVLTKRFFSSPICLCEMGATWVQTKEHIPIVVPPLGFDDIKGVIPLTQGFKVNDVLKLNLFKDKVASTLGFAPSLSQSTWERKRDKIVARINEMIAKT